MKKEEEDENKIQNPNPFSFVFVVSIQVVVLIIQFFLSNVEYKSHQNPTKNVIGQNCKLLIYVPRCFDFYTPLFERSRFIA